MGDTCTIGIDLGTSNSCVAIHSPAGYEVIRNRLGGLTTPSVVAAGQSGEIVVGDKANRQAIMNPEGTIFGVKRLVGRKFGSPEVAELRHTLPYPIVEAPNRDAWVRLLERSMSPSEVQSYILEELRSAAEDFLSVNVTRAIITVPAFFDEAQRQATRDAGAIAGFTNVRVLAEPTAAALAHGIGGQSDRLIVVFDMGGGTLDVSVMHVEEGRYDVLATTGDMLLGGADFDRALATEFAREIERDFGVSVLDNKVALQRLMTEAEGAKKTLTGLDSVTISLPYLAAGPSGQIDFERHLNRGELNALVAPLVERMMVPCRQALADAQLSVDRVDEVLLVGGMTRSPVVQDAVSQFFGRKPSQKINPDEAVAAGAGLLAGMTDGKVQGAQLIDVAPHSLGMRVAGNRLSPLIRRATKLPAVAKKAFATTEDGQRTVEIQLYQGEDPVASKNKALSTVSLSGIEPAPRGTVKVGVEFHASEDGKMSIRARQLGTNKEEMAVEIAAQTGLGRAVVGRLAQERAAARGPRRAARKPQSEAAQQSGFGIQFATGQASSSPAASAVSAGAGASRPPAAGAGRPSTAPGQRSGRAVGNDTAAQARAAILGDAFDESSEKGADVPANGSHRARSSAPAAGAARLVDTPKIGAARVVAPPGDGAGAMPAAQRAQAAPAPVPTDEQSRARGESAVTARRPVVVWVALGLVAAAAVAALVAVAL